LWSPGIKLGVREGSPTHVTELFGPVLAVMRADDLEHALRIVNGTPYGLTSGLFSLDEREQVSWKTRVRAGNLYINRPITGAIVQRQPFGGVKASSVGPGAKAGGPNYVLQLTRIAQREPPEVEGPPTPAAAALLVQVRKHLLPPARERLSTAACSYGHAMRTHFALEHDPSAVVGERNALRYVPCAPLLVRAGAEADPLEVLLASTAAISACASFTLSLDPALAARVPALAGLPEVTSVIEDAAAAAERVTPALDRVRVVGGVEPGVARACDAALVHLHAGPVLLTGRVELLAYVREQAVSHRYHRYGNLTPERLLPPR
jgi:RHH-type proline utilization regulon transcriptional repressor/proline dehydrogenase/delta 1-pyrroline-5-carboxylate dehydrogenase